MWDSPETASGGTNVNSAPGDAGVAEIDAAVDAVARIDQKANPEAYELALVAVQQAVQAYPHLMTYANNRLADKDPSQFQDADARMHNAIVDEEQGLDDVTKAANEKQEREDFSPLAAAITAGLALASFIGANGNREKGNDFLQEVEPEQSIEHQGGKPQHRVSEHAAPGRQERLER